MFLAFCLVSVATASCSGPQCAPENPQPVIGIMTQPTDSSNSAYGDQYVVASLVKWIEAAGARAYFVYYDAPQSDLKTLFTTQLNGLLLPGGDTSIFSGLYAQTTQFLISLIVDMNKKADYFPIWGTCQGFEQIVLYFANDTSILVNRSLENVVVPVNLTIDPGMSHLLNQASDTVISALMYENVTVNVHQRGFDPKSFVDNQYLAGNFTVVSTNMDENGQEFVSLVEGFGQPLYGSQFHPEKNQFEWEQEWSSDPNSHIADATATMQYLADSLVKEARKSQHPFKGGVPTAGALALTMTPLYTAKLAPYYEQTYFFKNHV